MFYKETYIAAFSEQSGPTHFQQVYDIEEEGNFGDFVLTGCMERVWWMECEWCHPSTLHTAQVQGYGG